MVIKENTKLMQTIVQMQIKNDILRKGIKRSFTVIGSYYENRYTLILKSDCKDSIYHMFQNQSSSPMEIRYSIKNDVSFQSLEDLKKKAKEDLGFTEIVIHLIGDKQSVKIDDVTFE